MSAKGAWWRRVIVVVVMYRVFYVIHGNGRRTCRGTKSRGEIEGARVDLDVPSHIPRAAALSSTGDAARAVVGFGDSITDGRGTTTNGQNRWTDVLATRVQNNAATANQVGVLNAGIGGTLASGEAINRYDHDVLEQSGRRYVIILYGINDIIYGGASSSTVIDAYQSYITRAHNNNVLAYGGTILPFNGFSDYTAAREQVRQEVNDWIRSTGAGSSGFDAVIDFDAALRNPNDTSRLLSTYDSGDHLHPGPAGYQRMGETIDLNLLSN